MAARFRWLAAAWLLGSLALTPRGLAGCLAARVPGPLAGWPVWLAGCSSPWGFPEIRIRKKQRQKKGRALTSPLSENALSGLRASSPRVPQERFRQWADSLRRPGRRLALNHFSRFVLLRLRGCKTKIIYIFFWGGHPSLGRHSGRPFVSNAVFFQAQLWVSAAEL